MSPTPSRPGSRAQAHRSRWLLAAALAVLGCSHDWDAYDPRGTSPPPGTGGMGGMGGMGGSGTTTTSSTTDGTGGMAGAGGAGGSGGAGAGNPDCTADGLLRLKDDFEDGSFDPAWNAEQYAGATVTEEGGTLTVALPDTNESQYAALTSVDHYNLTGCGFAARVVEVPDAGTHGYGQMYVEAEGVGVVEIIKDAQDLLFKKIIGAEHTVLASTPYDPILHALWRIRERDGVVYWETSANGQAWAIRAMEPAPIPIDSLHIRVGAGTYQVEPLAPGAFRVDAVNILP